VSDKRAEILNIAVKAAKREGLRSVSFRQLADAVGVKSSSVHYYFPTKPDLAGSMVRDYTEQFEARLAGIAARESTLQGKIDGLIQVFAEVLEGDDLCLCGMMAAELTALDTKTRAALRHFFRAAEDWLTEQIGAHRREVQVDLAPEPLAKAILSALEGAILLDRVEGDQGHLLAVAQVTRTLLH
jgi:TetR/AcrR family transcriptional repressor of nem operon